MDIENEISERQEREQAQVLEAVRNRLEVIGPDFRHGLTTLWLASGSASLAVLSLIATIWHDGIFPRQALLPLTFFVVGLISMGIGTAMYFWKEARVLGTMELASSTKRFPMGHAKSPTQRVGLTFSDPRTKGAILSAILFVFGSAIGLFELWSNN